jgi:sortase (surface protein transpeptidase)
MAEQARIGLDNPVFSGRLRQPSSVSKLASDNQTPSAKRRLATDYTIRRTDYEPVTRRNYASASAKSPPTPNPESTIPTFLPVQPAPPLEDQFVPTMPTPVDAQPLRPLRRYSKLQLTLVGMACLVFVSGAVISWQTLQTNHSAAAQVSALAKHTSNSQNDAVPGTTKPSAQAIGQYLVAPDLARYLKIPKLGVNARVMQTGVTSSGALGTPNNVYDTAWYTGSAKPGQPGATLIDGHVSSWTTHGVFYGLKNLVAGDTIQIVRGDGVVLNYQVVRTQAYDANNVDMKAAMTPVTNGKPGLNLITCTGQIQKGTSQFNKRLIVFAQQM